MARVVLVEGVELQPLGGERDQLLLVAHEDVLPALQSGLHECDGNVIRDAVPPALRGDGLPPGERW